MSTTQIALEKLYQRFPWLLALSKEIGNNPQSARITPCTITTLDEWCGVHQTKTDTYDVKGYFFGTQGVLLGTIHPHLSVFDKIEKWLCASHTLGETVLKAASKNPDMQDIRCVVIIIRDLLKCDGARITLYFLPKERSMFGLIVDWTNARHEEVRTRITNLSLNSKSVCT